MVATVLLLLRLSLLATTTSAMCLSDSRSMSRRAALGGCGTFLCGGNSWVAIAAADPEVTTTSSGLKYFDVKEGSGAEPIAGQTVQVHYTGWLKDFDDFESKFDSSYDRRRPLSFAVGTGRVIRGWDEALLAGMKVGGTRRAIIPSDLAYGKRGAGGIIPPDATLYFEMTLVAVQ